MEKNVPYYISTYLLLHLEPLFIWKHLSRLSAKVNICLDESMKTFLLPTNTFETGFE